MRNFILNGILGTALAAGIGATGGCSLSDGGHADRHYGGDYGIRDNDRDHDRDRGDYAKSAGDRNTRIEDKLDDGRVNGSARSFDERKASRAADEGVPGAARREAELRNDRVEDRR